MFDALIKVGGSVCHTQSIKAYAPHWAALAGGYRLLFVVGGGLLADQVRALDQHLGLSNSAAHWMAIAAMDQSGYLLADFMPGVPLISDFGLWVAEENRESQSPNPKSVVLLPYLLLRQADPLPHSWEVTSDSLAAWLAGLAGVNRLILMKDVPGIYRAGLPGDSTTGNREILAEVDRSQLTDFEVVDAYFTKVLPPQIETWILSGHHPGRLARLLETGKTDGTRITPDRQTS